MRLILAISVLVLFFSCKKKEEQAPSTTSLSPCQSTYHAVSGNPARLKFTTATWWVYRDSVTLQSDSVYVSMASSNPTYFSTSGMSPNCPDYYESFSSCYQHTLNSRRDTIFIFNGAWMNAHISGAPYPTAYTPFYEGFWPQGHIGQDSIFLLDSVFVYDQYYHQVEKVVMQHAPAEDSLRTIYYTNADYGILRKDIFNANGTLKNKWVLKNKNVIR